MKLIFDDPTFSLQLLRAISQTYYKGADIENCLSTAYRIKESDFESWYNQWYKTAKRVHYYAKECLKFVHINTKYYTYSKKLFQIYCQILHIFKQKYSLFSFPCY